MQAREHMRSNHNCGVFQGLEAHLDGTAHFYFSGPATETPIPNSSANVDAAFVLMFGSQSPTWPSFINGSFNPPWIANTEFGKTTQAADYIIGRLSWGAVPEVNEAASAQGVIAHFHGADHEVKNRQDDDINTRRHLIRTANVYRTWSELPNGTLRCQMHKVEIRIDLRMTGPENEVATLDYEQLAAKWPVLEHYRQLMGLINSVHELRERGFRPSRILEESIAANEARFLDGTYVLPAPTFISVE
jgi:hypothetical protein